ncbi:hypothetical protein GETHLI_18870 [Geothrix limicola]|uniref:GNAT family N-acetyltransferase n=1 Tax=Geothrix limicola TaxID=2927978 RepID=A0ABQ5QGU5_9BACT|nr:GNAT family N-acetyltransferase [Geothrix limicola]GLH73385.1 hypothetical protein GETHLI_18870 [Geothrix limicola]
MDKSIQVSEQGFELRRLAEELALRHTPPQSVDLENLLPDWALEMVHELRVHQIELELQNEELRSAQKALEETHARYFDFYHSAPIGYFSLSESGVIRDVNLFAASRLGVPRMALMQQPFNKFVSREDQDDFYLHHKNLSGPGSSEQLDVRLVRSDGSEFWVHLEAAVVQNADGSSFIQMSMRELETKASLNHQTQLLEPVPFQPTWMHALFPGLSAPQTVPPSPPVPPKKDRVVPSIGRLHRISEIRDARVKDIAGVVAVHMASFQNFFLTFLGRRFLSHLYLEVTREPGAVFLVATSPENEIIGFAAGVPDLGAFYQRLARRKWLTFGLSSMRAAILQPSIIPRLWRSLGASRLAAHASYPATLMSLAVIPNQKRTGIGKRLIMRYLSRLKRDGVLGVCLTTDRDGNAPVLAFYEKLGFTRTREYCTREGRWICEFSIHPQECLIDP